MKVLKGLKYTKNDEWVKVDGNVLTIGITDYAQDKLSDIVYLEFPVAVGDKVSKGDDLVTIESVKAAAEVGSPADGEVVELNEALVDSTSDVNADPFGKAWMVKLKVDSTDALADLYDESGYEAYCEERG